MVRLLFMIKTLKHLGTRERREKRGRGVVFAFGLESFFYRVVERGRFY